MELFLGKAGGQDRGVHTGRHNQKSCSSDCTLRFQEGRCLIR